MNKEITQLPFFKKPTSQEEYDEGLKNYGKFGRLWQLGLADWMLTGQEEGYMKRGVYDRASELTGIDKRTLQNYVSIYKSINKSSLHSEDLTYSHYEKVSSLDLEQQQHFLQQAAENGWSVARLKQAIKNHEIEKERQQRQQQRKSLSESDKHFDDKETTVMSDSDKTDKPHKGFYQVEKIKKDRDEVKKDLSEKIEETKKDNYVEYEDIDQPLIYNEDAQSFLNKFNDKSIDLLLTDPPYSTDTEDIYEFVESWIYNALDKVKDTGRAYICIGAYPKEIHAYLNLLTSLLEWTVDAPLIWTYKNTLGQTPNMKYNLNYQMILHLYKETSTPLNNKITNEMFSVQEINAPDGRQGDRWFKWQKPDKLAQQLIFHSTKENNTIIDPFAGSGTFLLQANEYNRISYGCEYDIDTYNIALSRGCYEG